MRRVSYLVSLFLVGVFSCALCQSAISATRGGSNAVASADVLSVVGNKILRNGNSFVPKGVIFSFPLMPVHLFDIKPENEDQAKYIAENKEARDYYFGLGAYVGQAALPDLKDWGVNTVRFNVYDGSLDPLSPLYSDEYVTDVRRAVKRARSKGFIVIVGLFDGGQGDPKRPSILYETSPGRGLATAMTARAFRKIALMFRDDSGIMLEPLNEPYSPVKPIFGWEIWANGGIVNGQKYIGVNQLIKKLRDLGGKNVVVLQPLKGSFLDYPGGVVDPKNQVAYATHPFFKNGTTQSEWDSDFGLFAATHPIVLTAWNADARESWCTADLINLPRTFLNYLDQRRIGVVGFAFDAKGTIVVKYGGVPTIWPSHCDEVGGPGELLKRYFLSH